MKKLFGKIRRAIQDYDMISAGDRVAVAFSGGKDSTFLVYALKQLQKYFPRTFSVEAIIIDQGFKNIDFNGIEDLLKKLDVPYTIVPSRIAEIVFQTRKEKNPCSLCAHLRRGLLYDTAAKKNINKIALGHHLDDAIATLFLCMFYEGRTATFSPVTYLSRKKVYAIRPLIYLYESAIKTAAGELDFPILKNPCPEDGYTKREFASTLVRELSETIPDFRKRMLRALQNKEQLDLWF